jgi:putative colanic acid biosynthesis UDP-glucose lipid carrier transferase
MVRLLRGRSLVFFDESSGQVSAGFQSPSAVAELGLDIKLGVSSSLSERALRVARSRTKRMIDVVMASALIIAFLPILLLIAVAVKIESRGSVLFRQQRYGLNREIFTMVKFRSMTVSEASGSFRQVSPGDVRITKVGAFLRRTSLDELPQLFNVVIGHMSIVGPRPHAVAMDDAFSAVLPFYDDRHLVRPGITGLAQISGFRGPTDVVDKIITRIRHDRAYIQKWTLLLDFKIMLLTPFKLYGPNAL